jgi:hypothetical protein
VYALLTTYGIDTVGYAYHALALNADAMLVFDETRQDHFDLFGVRYAVGPPDHTFPSFIRPLGRFGRFWLYQVENTTGFFEVVPTGQTYAGNRDDFSDAMLGWMRQPWPSRAAHPIITLEDQRGAAEEVRRLAELGSTQPGLLLGTPSGRVLEEHVAPDSYTSRVEIDHPSLVMLKVSYHPGWRVTVDGDPAQPVMLAPSHIGVPVQSGTHVIRFEYLSSPYRRALLIGGLLGMALFGFGEWQLRGRTGSPLAAPNLRG